MSRTPATHPHASGPPAIEAGGILTIDLGSVVANWRDLAARAEGAECAAVVKADAYGCGIDQVCAALGEAGCETFFVAHPSEARAVRAVRHNAIIYVLNGLLPGTCEAYAADNLRPIIGSAPELDEWVAFRKASGWTGGSALHVDTGMNRLGFEVGEVAGAAASLSREHGVALIMSHFACAEEPAHPLNARQISAFRAVRALFPGIPGSLANSSGIFLGPDAHHDMVRPGVALYGANPTPEHLNPMQPVLRLEGRVVQVRAVEAGDTVGYSATWTTRRPSRLAVVSVGYADGFLRAASATDARPGAEAVVAGQRCPIAGRVSMDLIVVDVTDLPEDRPGRGDLVTLLGDGIGIDDLAAHARTIAYEVLTGLGRRYRRIYRG